MIRIAIVDDHAVVRAGLRHILGSQPDFQVVSEGSSGQEALDIARAAPLDVMVLDIAMAGCGGVDVLLAIKARMPDLPVLILSGLPEEPYAMALLRHGASGYLSKRCEPAELIGAIRTVGRGRRYISASVAEQLAEGWACEGRASLHERLSDREFQVFLHLAGGATVGRTADGMSLSVKTVSTYRTRVMEKLKLASNSELTYYAMKNGLMQ